MAQYLGFIQNGFLAVFRSGKTQCSAVSFYGKNTAQPCANTPQHGEKYILHK